jgi:hypothetical protein
LLLPSLPLSFEPPLRQPSAGGFPHVPREIRGFCAVVRAAFASGFENFRRRIESAPFAAKHAPVGGKTSTGGARQATFGKNVSTKIDQLPALSVDARAVGPAPWPAVFTSVRRPLDLVRRGC